MRASYIYILVIFILAACTKSNINFDQIDEQFGSEFFTSINISEGLGDSYGILPEENNSFSLLTVLGQGGLSVLKFDSNQEDLNAFSVFNESNVQGTSFRHTQDGGHIITGYQYYGIDDRASIVSKTSIYGYTEWALLFREDESEVSVDALELPDGSFLVAGYVETEINSINRDIPFVRKVNSEGEVEWTKVYGTADYGRTFSIQLGQDGNVIIFRGAPSSLIIDKISFEGEIISSTKIPEIQSHTHQWKITKTLDSGFLIGCQYHSNNSLDNNYYGPLLLKLNSDLDLIWIRTYQNSELDIIYDIIETPDRSIFLLGSAFHNSIDISDMAVMKTSDNGSPTWLNIYGEEDSRDYISVGCLLLDGTILIAGGAVLEDNMSAQHVFLKIDQNGFPQ